MATEAEDAFMYFDLTAGVRIEGEARDERTTFTGEETMWQRYAFQIQSVGYSVTNKTNIGKAAGTDTGSGGGGENTDAGKVTFEKVVIKKMCDQSTPNLMLACAKGEKFKWAKIELRRNYKTYMIITLEDCIISKAGVEQSGDEEATDTIEIDYARIVVEYSSQGEDGDFWISHRAGWDREIGKYYDI
ncbi:MAG: type VI secretion system tube protein Hcp [Pseudomonadota bacterium]